jgi:hypothetical protein
MILIKSSRLVYLFGILLIIFLPLLSYFVGTPPLAGEEPMEDFTSVIIPLFIVIELMLYLLFGLVSGGCSTFYYLLQYCLIMFLFRLLCCFASGFMFSNYNETRSLDILLYFWMGSPLLVLIQIFLLMMLGPFIAWFVNPRIISDKALGFVGERRGILDSRIKLSSSKEAAPVGGFIRVYNYEELGRLFMNMMGIEGYILYTNEGLILYKDCQLRFDADRMVAVSLEEWEEYKTSQQKIGFHEPERIISQTNDQSFYGIYIFKRGVDVHEVLNRLEPLARSARELLEMKYSPII